MNKQGIMVLCKGFQPQGIRELRCLVKSSSLVHGVTGKRQWQEDYLCEDLKDWRRQWKSHGRRSLVGCSPWGR